jgi:uncharacterized glyoxalase superfamily protein PhnB
VNVKWTRTNPVYPVADVAAAIAWYHERFDFTAGHVNQTPDGPNYAVLTHAGASVLHLLSQRDAPHELAAPVEAQFWIDGDVDALFTKVNGLGTRVVQRPADQPWGHRDFIVADPDSNLVWITTSLPRAPR